MKRSRGPVGVFLSAESVALVANAGFLVVFPWLVLSRTGSVSQMSWVTALVTVPTAIATLLAGRAIDRYGQKRSSVVTGLGCALAAVGFGLADHAGDLTLPVVIALGALAQLFVPPSTTARDALMGPVADASGMRLERLAGTRQVVFSLAYAGGPALAGLALRHVTAVDLLWVIAGAWLVAALLTMLLPTVDPSTVAAGRAADGPAVSVAPTSATPTGQRRQRGQKEASGWRIVAARPAILAAVVIGFGASVITQPMTGVVLPAHFRALAQPDMYGYAVAAFAAGALIGAIGYAITGAKAGRAGFVTAVLVATAGMVLFAILPGFWLLATGLALGGLGSGFLAPALMVAVTTNTATNERGRVLGVYNAASLGAAPIGLGLLSLLMTHTTNLHTGAVAILTVWALVALYALATSRALFHNPTPASAGASGATTAAQAATEHEAGQGPC